MCTVIDDLRRTHRGTCLSIVETNAVTTTGDKLGVHAITTHCVDSNLTNFMLRQLRHEIGLMTIVCYGNSDVSLTSAWNDAE